MYVYVFGEGRGRRGRKEEEEREEREREKELCLNIQTCTLYIHLCTFNRQLILHVSVLVIGWIEWERG